MLFQSGFRTVSFFCSITSVITTDLKGSKNDVIEVWIFSSNGSGVRTVLYYINLLRFTAVFTKSQLDNWFPSSYMAIYGAVLCEMTVYINVIWALLQKLTLPCCLFVPEMHEHTTVILHVYIVQFWHCECVCVPGVERWLGKPWGLVTGYTTIPQLHNRLIDWLHIAATHAGLSAQYAAKLRHFSVLPPSNKNIKQLLKL